MVMRISIFIVICIVSILLVSVQYFCTPLIKRQDLVLSNTQDTIAIVDKMNDEFIEALLVWNQKSANNLVGQWLQQQGLNITPMKAGLLISGTRDQFEIVFSVNLKDADTPIEIPVPVAIQEHVLSIGIPKQRQPF